MPEYLALQTALIAFVYATILTEPGMLLHGCYNWLYKKLKIREEHTVGCLVFMPLIGCTKCVAGQLAFWAYLFTTTNHHLLEHAYVCALSILITLPLRKFYIWTLRN